MKEEGRAEAGAPTAARNFVRETNYRRESARALARDMMSVEFAPRLEVPRALSLRQWLEITETQPDP